LIFTADVLDVDFILEADAGLDFGVIDLVVKNNKAKPTYKDEQR
jgi:ATP-dependent protease ClpP protease subunit